MRVYSRNEVETITSINSSKTTSRGVIIMCGSLLHCFLLGLVLRMGLSWFCCFDQNLGYMDVSTVRSHEYIFPIWRSMVFNWLQCWAHLFVVVVREDRDSHVLHRQCL